MAGFGWLKRGLLEQVGLSWALDMSRISVARTVLVKGPGKGGGGSLPTRGNSSSKSREV